MSNREVKQRGFGVVRGVAFLVVAGIIVSVAWLAYSNYQNTHHVKQANNAAVSTSANASTSMAPTVAQQAANIANQNVVKLPELGIQISVPNDIKDLKYQVHTGALRNGNQATFAFFTTAALTGLDSDCSASSAPLGSLEKANGQYPSGDQYAALDYGRMVKQFPTFYISAGLPQAACSTHASVNAAAIKFKHEFTTAESTIQQLN
jgi:Tfp pilus assembly protein PilE